MASGALREAPEAMAALGLPPQATVLGVALPAGLLTGSTNTSVAMSVPMLAALPGGATPAAVALAFVCDFSGPMLTPTHRCPVLSLQHFRTPFAPVQRLLVLPEAALVATATLTLLLRPL